MLQQNGQSPSKPPFSHNQHVFPAAGSAASPQDNAPFFNNLDVSSSAAKQLAALNAVGMARRATQSGGTSGTFVGGMPPPSHHQPPNHQSPFRPASDSSHQALMATTDPSLQHGVQNSMHPMANNTGQPFQTSITQDPSAFYRSHHPNMQQQQMLPAQMAAFKQRQQQFLHSLAKMMEGRKTPLPPFVTGIHAPYDPSTSRWKQLEPASEVGGFRLAGRDVDLLRLWTYVLQSGGSLKLNQTNGWSSLLPHFGLPERLPNVLDANASTAQALASHFMAILGPSEELYHKNYEQRQAMQQSRLAQGQQPIPNGVPNSLQSGMLPSGSQHFGMPQTPQMRPGMGPGMTSTGTSSMPLAGGSSEVTGDSLPTSGEADLDLEGRKRKLGDMDDPNIKRIRRRTDSEPPHTPSRDSDSLVNATTPNGPQSQPSRRKIEYVPLAREVDSAGGRDIQLLHQEAHRLSRGRPLRDITEWGTVHVEALTMSLRSRLATELSYGLATLSILSTMRGGTPDSGFPIMQCTDLLDEVLDLLEELAFGGALDDDLLKFSEDDISVITNRELVRFAQEAGYTTFSALSPRQRECAPDLGPSQRPGDLIRILVNIMRNLSAIVDNQPFMAHHATIVDLLLRLTVLHCTPEGPRAASKSLSIADLVSIRKDVLGTLVNLAGSITIGGSSDSQTPSPKDLQKARRIFELISSYLSDPIEAISPCSWLSQTSQGMQHRVPVLVESSLEVFTRFGQPDANRRALSLAVPQSWVWTLFTALVHRLPVIDHDFRLLMRDESWLLCAERIVMALYSLAFQMRPAMKQRAKADRSLGFTPLLTRLVNKFIAHSPAECRQTFVVCARRAIETMKVVDDCKDSFDSAQPNIAPLTFGIGYGEVGDDSAEKGTGALGGYRDDLLWGVMLHRELDDVMFTELESLTRVECA